MPSALATALGLLRNYITDSTGRMKTVARASGTFGQRAAPARGGNHDSKIGLRLDNGKSFSKNGKKYMRYELQANKNADNATLKQMANKDSHKVHSYADVEVLDKDPGTDQAKKIVEDVFEQLERNLE